MMNSTVLKFRRVQRSLSEVGRTRKIVILASVMLLFGNNATDCLDFDFESLMNENAGLTGNYGLSNRKQIEGDFKRLLNLLYNDSSRGESPDKLFVYDDVTETYKLNESKNWLNSGYSWSANPAEETEYVGSDENRKSKLKYPKLTPTKQREIDDAKTIAVVKHYAKDGAVGLETLKADIAALESKKNEAKNGSLRGVLELLISIAKNAEKIFNTGMMKDQINTIMPTFMPSNLGDVSLSKAREDVQLNLETAKAGRKQELIGVYTEVLKQLDAISQEIQTLKRSNNNSITAALAAANKKLLIAQGQKSTAQINLYKEVIAQLEKDIALESGTQSKVADVMKALMKKSLPEAFAQAESKLRVAQGINQKEDIALYSQVIKQLEKVGSEIETLKIENNHSAQEALAKAQQDLLSFKSKPEYRNQFDLYESVIKQLELELYSEKKLDDAKSLAITTTKDSVKAVQLAREKLQILEIELKDLESRRNPAYQAKIKSLQAQIGEQIKLIDVLDIEAKKEDVVLDRKVEELLKKHNGKVQKAFEELDAKVNPKGSWFGYGAPTQVASTDPVDKGMLAKLKKMIDEGNANDPLSAAMKRYNQMTDISEFPSVFYGIVDGLFAKSGVSTRVSTLSVSKKQELEVVLRRAQADLSAIMSNSSMPTFAKSQAKQEVMTSVMAQVRNLFVRELAKVDYEVLKTGDSKAIAMNAAVNNLLDWMIPADSMAGGAAPAATSFDPKLGAYQTLGLQYGAGIRDINSSYRRLAMANHPDRGGDANKFREIQQAYELLNPDKLTA